MTTLTIIILSALTVSRGLFMLLFIKNIALSKIIKTPHSLCFLHCKIVVLRFYYFVNIFIYRFHFKRNEISF